MPECGTVGSLDFRAHPAIRWPCLQLPAASWVLGSFSRPRRAKEKKETGGADFELMVIMLPVTRLGGMVHLHVRTSYLPTSKYGVLW